LYLPVWFFRSFLVSSHPFHSCWSRRSGQTRFSVNSTCLSVIHLLIKNRCLNTR
jgi:hypothetical protein